MKQKKEDRKEVLLEYVDKLRAIKLPPEWQVSKLDVTFKRSGFLEEYAEVIYDDRNNVFYVKTNKCIVYPNDLKALNEGIEIMDKANKVIKETVIAKE